MSTINPISPRTISLNAERPRGYLGAEQVRNRAAVTKVGDSLPQRRAVSRLEQVLSPDQAPKADVPRGYYLDITV
ncbi:MAG TPA: hypothetical protein ENI69_06465 [Rhodospirillales bacterium]|nr:hypothetical protein [Rhodospirillales bacterium]